MLNIWMSELTEEGEDVKCMLSTWVSELTEEGERMSRVLSICLCELTEAGQRAKLGVDYLDVRTDRRRCQNRPKKV